MTALTNDEFASRVFDLAKPVEKFTPTAYFDHDGDCIEFLASPDNFYGERVDDLVTVYYSETTGEVVGSLLKGVRVLCDKILARLPGFKIVIRHDKVKLDHIFLAHFLSFAENPGELATLAYEKLIDVASRTGIEVNLTKAA
jgi:hypothetical protein